MRYVYLAGEPRDGHCPQFSGVDDSNGKVSYSLVYATPRVPKDDMLGVRHVGDLAFYGATKAAQPDHDVRFSPPLQ
jgi:hypothetical protein